MRHLGRAAVAGLTRPRPRGNNLGLRGPNTPAPPSPPPGSSAPRRGARTATSDVITYMEVDRILRATSHFETLGLAEGVSVDVASVRSRYQRLVMLVHPDKCTHPRAREAFEKVTTAQKMVGTSQQQQHKAASYVAKEANEHRLYKELDKKAILAQLALSPGIAQIELNKAEAGHRSTFVAGWRPAIGWACGAGIIVHEIGHGISNRLTGGF